MTKLQFIWHYFLLNKYSYLFAVVCIFVVNWLQVEIPRYIQQAIDFLNEVSDAAPGVLTEHVQGVIVLSLLMIMVRILSRIYALNPGRITEIALKNDWIFTRLQYPVCLFTDARMDVANFTQTDFVFRDTDHHRVHLFFHRISQITPTAGAAINQTAGFI